MTSTSNSTGGMTSTGGTSSIVAVGGSTAVSTGGLSATGGSISVMQREDLLHVAKPRLERIQLTTITEVYRVLRALRLLHVLQVKLLVIAFVQYLASVRQCQGAPLQVVNRQRRQNIHKPIFNGHVHSFYAN